MLAKLILIVFTLFLLGLFLTFMGFVTGVSKLLFPPQPSSESKRIKELEETIRLAEEALRESKEFHDRQR